MQCLCVDSHIESKEISWLMASNPLGWLITFINFWIICTCIIDSAFVEILQWFFTLVSKSVMTL